MTNLTKATDRAVAEENRRFLASPAAIAAAQGYGDQMRRRLEVAGVIRPLDPKAPHLDQPFGDWKAMEATLAPGHLGYVLGDVEVKVLNVGEVGHERVAIVKQLTGRQNLIGSVDVKFVGDISPRTDDEYAEWIDADLPGRAGSWPAWRKA
jgi:hypothetical protein